MSYKWPRRVQDMTPLQRGSTEEEPKSPELIKKNPPRLLPKRVSEMTPLKSDTDEEIDGPDDDKDNNLNCARRLTQFDYLSSADSDSDTPKQLPNSPPTKKTTTTINVPASAQNENNRNKLNSPSASAATSQPATTSKSSSSSSSISSTLSAPLVNELQNCKPFAAAAMPNSTLNAPSSSSVHQPRPPQPYTNQSNARLLPARPRTDAVYRQMMPSLGVHRQQQQQPKQASLSSSSSAAVASAPARPSTAFSDIDEARPNLSVFKNLHRASSSAHVRSASNDAPHVRLPHINRGQATTATGRCSDPSNSSSAAAAGAASNSGAAIKPNVAAPSSTAAASNNAGTAAIFKTPAIEFTSQRVAPSSRFPSLVRTNSSKSRSEMQSEFQTKKVLFHTPSTMRSSSVDKVPLSVAIAQADHSIDLSLDDSVPAPQAKPSLVTAAAAAPSSAVRVRVPVQPVNKSDVADANALPTGDSVLHINGKVFVVQRRIGTGGSSTVYLAQQWDTKAEVAVKVVDLQGDPAVVTGYMNETKLLAKLQGDDTVIRLFEYVHVAAESTLFVVMERGDHDLHHVLRSYATTAMPLYVLMRLWHQMLLAVGYIHRNGVIHSDLKPANFLLVDGQLKLIDFGIASNIAVDSTSIIKFSQAGTFNYISPEALIDTSTGDSPARGSSHQQQQQQPKIKISTKSDVWSLGCILYLLLYKRTPFAHITNLHTKMMAIVSSTTKIEYGPLPNFVPGIFLEMLERCLVYAPKQRVSVAELLKSPYDIVVPHDTLGLISEQRPSTTSAAAAATQQQQPPPLSSTART